jgi:hypothetical protein
MEFMESDNVSGVFNFALNGVNRVNGGEGRWKSEMNVKVGKREI